jgi:hypothetical protein
MNVDWYKESFSTLKLIYYIQAHKYIIMHQRFKQTKSMQKEERHEE